jgi:hypothetical protein
LLLCCAGIGVYWFAVCRLTPLAAVSLGEPDASDGSEPDELPEQSELSELDEPNSSDNGFLAIPAQASTEPEPSSVHTSA